MPAETAPHAFQTTRWSLVRRAAGDDPAAREALGALCQACWDPIYAYLRRTGRAPHDAEDLAQGFFERVLRRQTFADADPAKGRLRTFLLACLRSYLADGHDRAQAQKRGTGRVVSFDAAEAEERYAAEPADALTPDRLFQRRWALTVLEASLGLLRAEFAAQGKSELFEALRPFLGFGPDPTQRYEELAAAHATPVGTLKNQVFRLRTRRRELLFEQVAATLDDPTPENIKGELSELLGCL